MKTIVMTFLLFLLTFTLSACAPTQEAEFSEEVFLKEIEKNLECLNSCALEIFCAEVDFETEYLAAYKDENSFKDGIDDVAVLYLSEDVKEYTQYFVDPAQASYYPVLNFKTNDEVRQYLRAYLSDAIINEWFHDDFLEYDGKLFLRRGSRGYGAVSCDLDSLKYIGEKDGKHCITIDFKLFDEYDYTDTLEFLKSDEGWIIANKIENQGKTLATFDQISDYLWGQAKETYSPYYQVVGFKIFNYKENTNDDSIEAVLNLTVFHKNFDKDPDTVEYIKEAKEKNDPYYQRYYDEYLAIQEMNMELKVTIENDEIILCMDRDPTGGRDWREFQMSQTIMEDV